MPSVVALVPAHNEEAGIRHAVEGLARQTVPPAQIIVIANNCRDRTAAVAEAAGATVMVMTHNRDKKAGALNWALRQILPSMAADDIVIVQDADSQLHPDFVARALGYLFADVKLGAVGGVFTGGPGGGFVGHLQRNEYARYARDIERLAGRCLVVTGTAAVFRAQTLREISAARMDGRLPPGDGTGGIYDTTVMTEDNEISFALLHLGYKILSPADCTLVTEVMESWRELWRQRLRWKRGAIENCFQYGITRVTAPYWGRQILTLLGLLVTTCYLSTLVWSLVALGGVAIHPFWLGVTGIFVLERTVTISRRGWRFMLPAATMYELVIDLFLQAVHARAYLDTLLRRKRCW